MVTRRTTWTGGIAVMVAATVVALLLRTHSQAAEQSKEEPAATEVAVHVGEIGRATLHRTVTAYGTVEPEPATGGHPPARASLGPAVSGVLVGIDCTEGQRVSAGATLFRLDSRTAEVELARARQTADFADTTLKRKRALLEAGGASEKDVLEAEQARDAAASDVKAAETRLALLRVTAPLAGTVTRIDARLGQTVDAGTVLAEIVDLHRLVVTAGVPSIEVAQVAAGQPVEIGREAPVQGRVTRVGSEVDPRTDTLQVRAAVPGETGLRPGQLVEIRIVTEEHRDVLTVPIDSLVTRAGEGSWIARVEGERAVRTPVTPGLREGGRVEITGEGLREGMPIVTDEAYGLPAETRIRILER